MFIVYFYTHYKRIGHIIMPKPYFSSNEGINSLSPFLLIAFRRFGSIRRRNNRSCQHSGIQVVAILAFRLSPFWHSGCRHSGIQVVAILAFRLSPFWHSGCCHSGIQVVAILAFRLSPFWHSGCCHSGIQVVAGPMGRC